MKCVIQRVLSAEVGVGCDCVGKIDRGLLVYLGFASGDTTKEADYVVDRVSKIRIFEDDAGKLNRALDEVGGEVLLIPNFTLYADATTGRRPSFVNAMRFEQASALFDYCAARLDTLIDKKCEKGIFGADMKIASVADGPLNIIIEYNNAEK